MNTGAIDFALLAAPLAAGLLVVLTHVPMGRAVLARGIIFIDLAVAQVAGLGVVAAYLLGHDVNGLALQLTAGGAALGGALLLRLTEKFWPEVQEAIIGCMFVLAATGALLALAHDPHGAEHMRDLLSGQVLWVDWSQLWPVALLYAAVLTGWFAGAGRRPLGFYLLFALTVTASVQLVGLYLVFASLIMPALAVRQLGNRSGLAAGYGVGAGAYALGLLASAVFDLPAGPVVVWLLALLGALAWALSSRTRTPAVGGPLAPSRNG